MDVQVSIRTVNLSIKLIRQMPYVDYAEALPYLTREKGKVLGWIAQRMLDKDDDNRWLIIQLENGSFARYNPALDTCKLFEQIYIP